MESFSRPAGAGPGEGASLQSATWPAARLSI